MSRVVNNQYVVANDGFQAVSVPNSVRFPAMPSPIGGQVHRKYATSTSANVLGAGETIQFEVPAKGLIMPGTFMKFKIQTQNAGGAGNSITLGHSSQVIRRLEVRVGSSSTDNISSYNKIYSLLKLANMPTTYANSDGKVLEFIDEQLPVNATAPAWSDATELVCPLLSGIFTHEKAIPAELFNAPITVTIELAPATDLGHSGQTYRITEPKLYYDVCEMPPEYYMALRAELASQGILKLDYTTFTSHQYGVGATGQLNAQLAENCSSLLGILAGAQIGTDVGSSAQGNLFNRNGWDYAEFRVDGSLDPSYRIDSPILSYCNVQKMFSSLFDVDHTGFVNRDVYMGASYYYGLNTTRYHEANLSQTGTAVKNNIEVLVSGNTDASTHYLFSIKQYSLLIDPTGNVQIAK